MSAIKGKISILNSWLRKQEKLVLFLLFVFIFVSGITFDEIHKIILLVVITPMLAIEIIRVGKIYIDIREFIIITGMAGFYIMWGENVTQGLGFSLLCLLSYVLSKYIVLSHYDSNSKIIVYSVLFFSMTLFLLGILEYLPLLKGYLVDGVFIGEEWNSFWKNERWPRTAYDCYFIMVSGLPVYAIYSIIKRKKTGLLLLMMSSMGVLITVLSYGRIILGSTFLTSLICLVFIIIHKRKNRNVRLICGLTLGICVLCLILFYIMYLYNIMGVADRINYSFLAGSGGIVHNVRFDLKRQHLKLLMKYPFGKCDVQVIGSDGDTYNMAHEVWLDIARRGGMIPFCLVCAYSIISTVDLLKVWKSDLVDEGTKICLTGVFYAVNILCWLEPIIIGRKSFWCITYMLAGLFRGVTVNQTAKQTEVVS